MKSMTDGLAEVQQSESMKPALVSIEDGWQLCYWLEDMGNGWVAVFLPQSPTPMSGNIMYFPAERIKILDIPMYDVIKLLQRIGKGSSEKLRNIDLGAF